MTMATRNHQQLLVLEQQIKPAPGAPWQERAVCAQTDPEIFFPERGGSTKEAKKICLSCSVKTQCLVDALDNDERFGIRGGYTEHERRRLQTADQAPSDTGLCGTSQGYQRHRYRGEQACAECRKAASDRTREARTLQAPTVGSMCGTESGSKTHSRRGERSCRECQNAATSARRRRNRTA